MNENVRNAPGDILLRFRHIGTGMRCEPPDLARRPALRDTQVMGSDTQSEMTARAGLGYALSAYLIWGLVPIYFKLLAHVNPVEIVAERAIFSLPFCLAILAVRGRMGDLFSAVRQPRVMKRLILSACLIAVNWLVLIAAVIDGHIIAASLGYYLTPLLTILLGNLVLREPLSRMHRVAIALSVIGVALLFLGALDTLWISLTVAFSFVLYGLVRKTTPVGSVEGLSIETALLVPAALVAIGWFALLPPGAAMFSDWTTGGLIAFAGVLTAIPLLLFASAARRLPLTTLGFFQYIAPTISFLIGLFVYEEPFDMIKLGSFLLIWTGIALVSVESILQGRNRRRAEAAEAQAFRMQ